MIYLIYNDKDNQHFLKDFKNSGDCRVWIVNTLDLSKGWNFDFYDIFDGIRKTNNIKKERV